MMRPTTSPMVVLRRPGASQVGCPRADLLVSRGRVPRVRHNRPAGMRPTALPMAGAALAGQVRGCPRVDLLDSRGRVPRVRHNRPAVMRPTVPPMADAAPAGSKQGGVSARRAATVRRCRSPGRGLAGFGGALDLRGLVAGLRTCGSGGVVGRGVRVVALVWAGLRRAGCAVVCGWADSASARQATLREIVASDRGCGCSGRLSPLRSAV